MSWTLHQGNCPDVMRTMPDNNIDAVVTDPPYGLEFMGREWDSFKSANAHAEARTRREADLRDASKGAYVRHAVNAYEAGHPYQVWCTSWAGKLLRAMKPGAYLLAMGGTRTVHRLTCGIEDAGFIIRDKLCWLHGQGFPKAQNIGKAIDRRADAERLVVGTDSRPQYDSCYAAWDKPCAKRSKHFGQGQWDITVPATPEAAQWAGWATALKPAHEDIILAQKPPDGTYAQNVAKWGCGALNIEGCRIASKAHEEPSLSGRWPANVLLNEEAAAMLDTEVGERGVSRKGSGTGNTVSVFHLRNLPTNMGYGDSGGPSRYFYVAKASQSERGEGNDHPTVKPLALMRYLCRLVCPPNGTILDPFAGSGTTLLAAVREGFNVVGIEKDAHYCDIIRQRMGAELPLFGSQEAGA